MAHEDIKYEQACILYNLGELPKPLPMVLSPQPCQPRMEHAWIRTLPRSASTSFLGHGEPPCWGEAVLGWLPHRVALGAPAGREG